MAFTDFKSPDEVQTAYHITYRQERFLQVIPQMPSAQFLADFEFNTT